MWCLGQMLKENKMIFEGMVVKCSVFFFDPPGGAFPQSAENETAEN